jgi:hypothetical protein
VEEGGGVGEDAAESAGFAGLTQGKDNAKPQRCAEVHGEGVSECGVEAARDSRIEESSSQSRPIHSQQAMGKEKSACFVRNNDGLPGGK